MSAIIQTDHFEGGELDRAAYAVSTLIEYLGEDPKREGLVETPQRVVRALVEMTSGYDEDPAAILSKTFGETSDELIVLRGVEFHSVCEHHLLPFVGNATVGYLPGRVVGISKLARVVDCFARRLQVQERLTRQIAEAVEEHLDAEGVGVIVTARHMCMACRGIRQTSVDMVTSAMLGKLGRSPTSRAEFLRLAGY